MNNWKVYLIGILIPLGVGISSSLLTMNTLGLAIILILLGISSGEKILPANIEFLNNYSDEINGGYYMLDNIKTGHKITQPPSPIREGYEFIGWFTDVNCSNIWNFDNIKKLKMVMNLDFMPDGNKNKKRDNEHENIYRK